MGGLLRGRAGRVGTCGWLGPVCWGPRLLPGGPAHALCLRTGEPGSPAPGALLCLFGDACWLSLLTTAAWLLCSETSLMSPFSGGLWFGKQALLVLVLSIESSRPGRPPGAPGTGQALHASQPRSRQPRLRAGVGELLQSPHLPSHRGAGDSGGS